MKSTLVPRQPEDKRSEYPCLKILRRLSQVVLFTEPNTGMVIHTLSVLNETGSYSDDWPEEMFNLYNGEVVLSNASSCKVTFS